MRTSLEASIAKLTRRVTPPTEPLGWGVDLSCVFDIDANASEVDPRSILAISQAVFRRFITARGTLDDDQEYGYDIRWLVNRGITAAYVPQLASDIAAEARKDQRVAQAECVCTFNSSTHKLTVRLHITAASSDESFELVFSVTDGDVLVEKLL